MTESPRRIAQIAINVHDLERAIRFYRDVLGLEFLADSEGNPVGLMSELPKGS